jgi:hypothetical protein
MPIQALKPSHTTTSFDPLTLRPALAAVFASSSLVPVPVIVRENADFAFYDVDLVGLFGEATRARQSMTGSLTPRLLHAFGQGGVLRASVEE